MDICPFFVLTLGIIGPLSRAQIVLVCFSRRLFLSFLYPARDEQSPSPRTFIWAGRKKVASPLSRVAPAFPRLTHGPAVNDEPTSTGSIYPLIAPRSQTYPFLPPVIQFQTSSFFPFRFLLSLFKKTCNPPFRDLVEGYPITWFLLLLFSEDVSEPPLMIFRSSLRTYYAFFSSPRTRLPVFSGTQDTREFLPPRRSTLMFHLNCASHLFFPLPCLLILLTFFPCRLPCNR